MAPQGDNTSRINLNHLIVMATDSTSAREIATTLTDTHTLVPRNFAMALTTIATGRLTRVIQAQVKRAGTAQQASVGSARRSAQGAASHVLAK
ncbi:MAG TPA: hypothetical protein VE222_06525 [Nitrospiraceae bacterium]|nr:hypothetical protein [Nitrospiraceae bacterium]